MNAKLADLISKRYSLSCGATFDHDRRRLVQSVFPQIAANAYKGLTNVTLTFINDNMANQLRLLGYIVKPSGSLAFDTIDWGMQTLIEPDGKIKKVTSSEYNEYLAAKQAIEESERVDQLAFES